MNTKNLALARQSLSVYAFHMSAPARYRFLTALALGIGAARIGHGQRPASAPCSADVVRQRVCAADDSLGVALIRADTAAIARVYADDLVSINYRGVRSTKPMLLAAIGARRLRFDTLRAQSRALEAHGDTVLLQQRMHRVATGPEGRHPSEVDYQRTYVRRAGRWQLVTTVIGVAAPLGAQSPDTSPPRGSVSVVRDGRPTLVTPSDLAKLPRRNVRVVAEGTGDSVTVSGVNLWDVLQFVGAPSPEASGRQRAVMYVRLKGSDGQNAVLALVEVDPGFSRRTVLMADQRDGKVLDETEGPWRVIIPDDQRHARWIRGLIGIEVVTLRP